MKHDTQLVLAVWILAICSCLSLVIAFTTGVLREHDPDLLLVQRLIMEQGQTIAGLESRMMQVEANLAELQKRINAMPPPPLDRRKPQ